MNVILKQNTPREFEVYCRLFFDKVSNVKKRKEEERKEERWKEERTIGL